MRLTITDLLKEEDNHSAIHVLNKTRGDTRGPIMFTVPGQGGTSIVRIPDTFLPINLVEQLPRQSILDSRDFRSAISSGMLHLIDESEALEILSKPGAKEEQARLRQERERISGYASEMIGEAATLDLDDDSNKLNRRMVALLNRIDEAGEVGVINSLRAISDDLGDNDLTHLAAFAKSRNFKKLAKFTSNLQDN